MLAAFSLITSPSIADAPPSIQLVSHAEAQVIHEQPVVEPKVAEVTANTVFCSCVRYVRSKIPEFPSNDAKNIKPNSVPVAGGVIILKYWNKELGQELYHVAYIESFTEKGFLVSETNFKKCQRTDREVLFTDKAIVGFWN